MSGPLGNILLVVLTCLICYGVAEVGFSTYRSFYPDIWLFEDSGRTIHFDPDRGYILQPTPSRFARITNGAIADMQLRGRLNLTGHRVIEYVGTFKGNNHGFPDRDDFALGHKPPGVRRYAIFGDSYSAAQYLETSWSDRVEQLFKDSGRTIELYNFSVDGGGLGNWHSIIFNIIEKNDYRLDGFIFAVFDADLNRTFSYSDHRGRKKHTFVRTDSFDPQNNPKRLDDILPLLKQGEIKNSFILSTDEFDRVMAGKMTVNEGWSPQLARYFVQKLAALGPAPPAVPVASDCGLWRCQQLKLLEQIRDFASVRNYDVIVFFISGRDALLKGTLNPRHFQQARVFAEMTAGKFFDGRQAFQGLPDREIDAAFFPYDGHWNQGGSDIFARYAAQKLSALAD
jgi:hypothetical protein